MKSQILKYFLYTDDEKVCDRDSSSINRDVQRETYIDIKQTNTYAETMRVSDISETASSLVNTGPGPYFMNCCC